MVISNCVEHTFMNRCRHIVSKKLFLLLDIVSLLLLISRQLPKHSCTHCKPGKAYMRLKTATCEAGPGTTHMCTLGICMCSVIIHHFDDE
jgi:hypothetical protein